MVTTTWARVFIIVSPTPPLCYAAVAGRLRTKSRQNGS
jgi:hypothetical protein